MGIVRYSYVPVDFCIDNREELRYIECSRGYTSASKDMQMRKFIIYKQAGFWSDSQVYFQDQARGRERGRRNNEA